MSTNREQSSPVRPAVIRRGLTRRQWEDVADLMEQAAAGFEIGYEDHDPKARERAAAWCRAQAERAFQKADNS